MGLFTLVACSEDVYQEDVYQETDKMNEEAGSQNQVSSFNDASPGGTTGSGISIQPSNYFSPWDIYFNRGTQHYEMQPSYIFNNGNNEGNYSPYTLRVYAWGGLAYFDGDNDGVFKDISQTGSPTIASMAANPTQYPNLYKISAGQHQEVGNLVRTSTPLTFNPLEQARIEDRADHLPMPGATLPRYATTWPAWANGFNFAGATTSQERTLLKQYGKIFFYEVDVFEGGVFIGKYYLHPEINTLPGGGRWQNVEDVLNNQQQWSGPPGTFKLYYLDNNTGNPTVYNPIAGTPGLTSNSHEVVLDAKNMHRANITTGSVPKTLIMDFAQHHQTFWYHSALSLRIQ